MAGWRDTTLTTQQQQQRQAGLGRADKDKLSGVRPGSVSSLSSPVLTIEIEINILHCPHTLLSVFLLL